MSQLIFPNDSSGTRWRLPREGRWYQRPSFGKRLRVRQGSCPPEMWGCPGERRKGQLAKCWVVGVGIFSVARAQALQAAC